MSKPFAKFAHECKQIPDFAQHLKPTLEEEVHEVLEKIEKLFAGKNEQYRTENDDLANFTTGSLLRYKDGSMNGKFEALKDYVEKHIAKVYNGKLDDDKMDESIMDIAVYFVIAMVMHKRMLQERGEDDE